MPLMLLAKKKSSVRQKKESKDESNIGQGKTGPSASSQEVTCLIYKSINFDNLFYKKIDLFTFCNYILFNFNFVRSLF